MRSPEILCGSASSAPEPPGYGGDIESCRDHEPDRGEATSPPLRAQLIHQEVLDLTAAREPELGG